MAEIRNLIITCGTSQTMQAKMKMMGLYDEAYQAFEKAIREKDVVCDHAFLDSLECVQQQDRILAGLAAQWGQRQATLGQFNCFGAEISTLTALQLRENGHGWEPSNDRLVLLSSETLGGQLNARILRRALEEIWAVPADHINLVVVHELNEKPANPETAMEQLAGQISEHLRESVSGQHCRNIFVATGGFKSSMPCITIFSLVFGYEMVYMFEQSSHLQSLFPHLEDTQARKFWQDTWKKMKREGWLNQMMPAYIRIALTSHLQGDQRLR